MSPTVTCWIGLHSVIRPLTCREEEQRDDCWCDTRCLFLWLLVTDRQTDALIFRLGRRTRRIRDES